MAEGKEKKEPKPEADFLGSKSSSSSPAMIVVHAPETGSPEQPARKQMKRQATTRGSAPNVFSPRPEPAKERSRELKREKSSTDEKKEEKKEGQEGEKKEKKEDKARTMARKERKQTSSSSSSSVPPPAPLPTHALVGQVQGGGGASQEGAGAQGEGESGRLR